MQEIGYSNNVDEDNNEAGENEEEEENEPVPSTSRPTTPATSKEHRGRKRSRDVVGSRILDYLENKQEGRQQAQQKEDPDRMFLLSLLPDMRAMTRQSKAAFKIKVLQLVEGSYETPHEPNPSSGSFAFDNESYQYPIVYDQGNTYHQM